ncbi:MAG: hypothetical protein ACR2IP_04240 [Solirubrobacteraceae bacterium]
MGIRPPREPGEVTSIRNRRGAALQRVTIATIATIAVLVAPASASALDPMKPICGGIGLISGIGGKACHVVQHAGRLAHAGKKLITGHPGAALKALSGSTTAASTASTALGLAAIGTWVTVGAKVALNMTAKVLSETTSPQLGTTWFSSAYWRIAGVAAVLTLPFLFAAAVQALMRSDLALLVRAAFGYLPLALLAVSVAAPMTMLLLAASDQLSGIVSSAAGNAGEHFLARAGAIAGTLSLLSRSPFLAFLVGLFTAAGAVVLWLELAMREAAVYVVVLMLPLAFAALVWPARRVWAIRAVELLVALILSKFAIVAVLALGGAALDQTGGKGATAMLAGFVLVVMGAFAPWALLRLLPLSELASGAAGSLRGEVRAHVQPAKEANKDRANAATGIAESMAAGMRRQAQEAGSQSDGQAAPSAAPPSAPRHPAGASILATSSADRSSGAGARGAEHEAGADGDLRGVDAAQSSGGEDAAVHEPLIATGGPSGGGSGGRGSDDAGAGAGSSGGGAATSTAASAAPRERLPGMGAIWQAPDMSWSTLELGPDGLSRDPLWAPEGGDGSHGAEGSGAEDHDPRPPEQGPEQGRL